MVLCDLLQFFISASFKISLPPVILSIIIIITHYPYFLFRLKNCPVMNNFSGITKLNAIPR